LLPFAAIGQHLVTPTNQVIKNRWEARWIGPKDKLNSYGVHHFRKTFSLSQKPHEFIIHISADNRYRLFVNGTYVTDGPQISDSRHWRFESLDIGPLLQSGNNVLAVQVVNFAEAAPVYVMGKRAGLIVQGNDSSARVVNSNSTWKYSTCNAFTPSVFLPGSPSVFYQYYAAGPLDSIDGSKFPWGWEQVSFNDSGWNTAAASETGAPFGVQGYGDATWELIPRSIPLMERTYEPIGVIRRSEGLTKEPTQFPITIPANTTSTILIDHQKLTSGFPELIVSKGKASQVKLTYAEALFNDIENKGHRDSVQGRQIHGVYEVFKPEGGMNRLYTTLTYRTFRYVQLDITTASEPLVIEKFGSWFTGYPFQKKGSFSSSDKELEKVFDIGWHTARLCAYETYMDCPYWERLQYIGDTRIQALVSYYVSGDDRLARNSIEQFYWSLTYDGLTTSRYPSSLAQYIPNYSLVWITMIHDYFMYRNDPEFVKSFLPGIERVLAHFEGYVTDDNMMTEQPYWDFLDHSFPTHKIVQESSFKKLTSNSLFYAYTLSLAAEILSAYDKPQLVQKYSLLSQKLKAGVKSQCWDGNRQLYADTPDKKHFSMHSNILALLCGMVPRDEQKEFIRRIVQAKDITRTTLYFDFYLGRAMNLAQAGDQYHQLLGQWKDFLNVGLTTFPEGVSRSECHAWSSSPNYEMPATLAGIQPLTAGFNKVLVRPLLDNLQFVKSSMPHWAGELSLELKKKGNQIEGKISLPPGITGRLEWGGKTMELKPGVNTVLL